MKYLSILCMLALVVVASSKRPGMILTYTQLKRITILIIFYFCFFVIVNFQFVFRTSKSLFDEFKKRENNCILL